MTEQPSRLLLQLGELKQTFDKVCTDTLTPLEIMEGDPVIRGLINQQYKAATKDWHLMLIDPELFKQKYPDLCQYWRLKGYTAQRGARVLRGEYYGDQRDATWAEWRDWPTATRVDEFQ